MECARRPAGMRNWSSSPTTAGTWVRRASRSGTLTRGVAPAAWPPSLGSEEPPALARPGARVVGLVGDLLRRQNLEHPRAAHRAHALQRGSAVRHFHLLRIRNLALGLALHAVAFIRCHRGSSFSRQSTPRYAARREW